MIIESDIAPEREIAHIVINGARLTKLKVEPDQIYLDRPVNPFWREDIVKGGITKPLNPTEHIISPHEARRRFFENIGA